VTGPTLQSAYPRPRSAALLTSAPGIHWREPSTPPQCGPSQLPREPHHTSTGSHWHEPYATRPSAHLRLHHCTSARPTGSHWHAATAAQTGAHQGYTWTHLTSRTIGVHVVLPDRTHPHVAGSHWRELTEARLCPPTTAAFAHVLPSHGQPSARAHCSTDRWPPSAALEHGSSLKKSQLLHQQPRARNQRSVSRCPCRAARCAAGHRLFLKFLLWSLVRQRNVQQGAQPRSQPQEHGTGGPSSASGGPQPRGPSQTHWQHL
jgi:hypothetical protein